MTPTITNFSHGFIITDAYRKVEFKGKPPVSFIGKVVCTILDNALGGLHNVPGHYKVDWSNERFIELNWETDLSSFDFGRLTNLLVLCHDACVRLEVSPCNMRYLKLRFHARAGREGPVSERHPDLEEQIVGIRSRKCYVTQAPKEVPPK